MQIGQAASASGVSAKMIRHYESIGLIGPAARRDSNYRTYQAEDLHRLRFIRRARDLGFSVERIRDLLKLWSDRDRSSAEVKAIALGHLAELDRKIDDMRAMAETVRRLAEACEGDRRPHCPILEGLAGADGFSAVQSASATVKQRNGQKP
jgi:Cu(I)-responsive transcriptional regulator